jgi:hypothetical protein
MKPLVRSTLARVALLAVVIDVAVGLALHWFGQ